MSCAQSLLATSVNTTEFVRFSAMCKLGIMKARAVLIGREDDGRWWADIELMPGVMAYGATRDSAIAAVRALGLRVEADCIDHGEAVSESLTAAFSIACAQPANKAPAVNCIHLSTTDVSHPFHPH